MHANFSARLLFSRGRLKTFDKYVCLGSLSVEMLFEQPELNSTQLITWPVIQNLSESHNCISIHVRDNAIIFVVLITRCIIVMLIHLGKSSQNQKLVNFS